MDADFLIDHSLTLSAADKKKLHQAAEAILKKDALAVALIQRLKDGEGKPKDQSSAIKLLKKTVDMKREAFRRWAKAYTPL